MYSVFVYTLDLFGFDGDIGLAKLIGEEAVSCFKQNYVNVATVLLFITKAFNPYDKRQLQRNLFT